MWQSSPVPRGDFFTKNVTFTLRIHRKSVIYEQSVCHVYVTKCHQWRFTSCRIFCEKNNLCFRLREASWSGRSGAFVQHGILPFRSQNTSYTQSERDPTRYCQYQPTEQAGMVSPSMHHIIFNGMTYVHFHQSRLTLISGGEINLFFIFF